MNELNTELRQLAVKLGLCNQWQSQWNGEKSQQELIDMYIKGLDFCLKHDYPNKNYIKQEFDHDLLVANHIYVDEDINLPNGISGIYVLNGECSGELHFSNWEVATIYVRHNTHVKVTASRFAKVFIRLYDDASAETESTRGGCIKQIQH
jgi:hypothetical protein